MNVFELVDNINSALTERSRNKQLKIFFKNCLELIDSYGQQQKNQEKVDMGGIVEFISQRVNQDYQKYSKASPKKEVQLNAIITHLLNNVTEFRMNVADRDDLANDLKKSLIDSESQNYKNFQEVVPEENQSSLITNSIQQSLGGCGSNISSVLANMQVALKMNGHGESKYKKSINFEESLIESANPYVECELDNRFSKCKNIKRISHNTSADNRNMEISNSSNYESDLESQESEDPIILYSEEDEQFQNSEYNNAYQRYSQGDDLLQAEQESEAQKEAVDPDGYLADDENLDQSASKNTEQSTKPNPLIIIALIVAHAIPVLLIALLIATAVKNKMDKKSNPEKKKHPGCWLFNLFPKRKSSEADDAVPMAQQKL